MCGGVQAFPNLVVCGRVQAFPNLVVCGGVYAVSSLVVCGGVQAFTNLVVYGGMQTLPSLCAGFFHYVCVVLFLKLLMKLLGFTSLLSLSPSLAALVVKCC